MKNSPVKFAHAALSVIVVLCFLATAIGQTDSCSQIIAGGGLHYDVGPNAQLVDTEGEQI